MAVELGSGYFSLFPKVDNKALRQATSEVEDDLEKAGRNAGDRAGEGFSGTFGAGIKKAVGLASVALAGFATVDFLKGAIGAASDLGEVTSKSAQIFGSEALPELEKFADGAATALGQSKTQALNAAATFATFGKSAGLTGGDLVGFSTQLVTLAGDMASFGNTTPEQAIEAIGAALRGESEPIRSYGVLLDDATLKNRALKLGIISSTKEALTPANKVLAAQAEILAQTSDTQGDFARTSGGLANQQRILAAQIENAKVKLGEAFLPVITKVMTFINTKAIVGVQAFGAEIKDRFVPAFAAFKQGLSGEGVTSDGFIGIMEGVGVKALELKGNVKLAADVFKSAFNEGDVTSDGWVGVIEQIAGPVGTLVRYLQTEVPAAFADFAAGFKNAGKELDTADVHGKLGLVGEKLGKLVDLVKNNPSIFQPIIAALGGMAAALVAFQAGTGAIAVLGALGNVLGGIGAFLPLVVSPVGLFALAVGALAVAAYFAYKKIKPFREAVDSVFRVFKGGGLGNAIDEAGYQIGRLWDLASPKLIEFGTNLVNFLRDKAPEWAAAFYGWVTDTALPWVNDKLGVLSTAIGNWVTGTAIPYLREKGPEWAAALGDWITETAVPYVVTKLGEWKDALGNWIDNTAIPYLQEKAPIWGRALVDWILDTALPWMIEKSGKLFAWFQEWLTDTVWPWLLGKAADWTKGLLGWLVTDAIPYLAEKNGELLGILIGFVLGAISSLASHAAEWVAAVLGWIQDAIGQAPGKLAELTGKFTGWAADIVSSLAGTGADIGRALVNGIIGKWNDLSLSLPEVDTHIPGLGKVGGFTLDTPNVPLLANGGVFTDATLAWIGEDRRTTPEIVTPESLMRATFRDELHAVDWGTGNAPGAGRPQVVQLVVDRKVLAEVLVRDQRSRR